MPQNRSNKLVIILIFTFFFLVYVTTSSGHFDPWDGAAYFLVTESIVLKHSVTVPPDLPALQMLSIHLPAMVQLTTTRALLAPTIAVPFYYAALVFSVSPVNVVALFANSIVMALICVVLFCFSLELYKSKKIALVLTLIFGVCSFIWPYNNSLLSEPTTTLCIFASAYFIYMSTRQDHTDNTIVIKNNTDLSSGSTTTSIINKIKNKNKRVYLAALGALFLGLSLISHPPSIVIIPAFLAYYIFSIRHINNRKVLLLSFFIVLGSVLLFAGLLNYMRFGSFTTFGYGKVSNPNPESLSIHQGWHGLLGLLISPGKGLVFYFPIVILFPLALRYMYAKNKGLFFICTYIFVAFWLFFGTISFGNRTQLPESETWSGGWWGARYMVLLLPFITLTCGTLLEHLKGNKRLLKLSVIMILSVAGFSVNLLGILVWFAYMYIGDVNRGQDYELMTWNPYHSFIVNYIEVLQSNTISHLQPVFLSLSNPGVTFYGLDPCPYNIYLYCKFGILPILSLTAVIAIVAMIILLKISNFKLPSILKSSGMK